MTFVRGMGGFYGRIQYVSTSCLRYGAPIQQLTSGCSVVLFRTKRFLGTKHFATFVLFRTKRFLSTKHVVEFIWFHLKRFRRTKLHEDCRLWPAAHEVESIAPAWRTSPHGPTGRRTWNLSFPYHMFEVYGFPRHRQTHETSQNANRQGLLQNLACFLATIRPVDTYKGVFGTPIGIRTQTVRTGI